MKMKTYGADSADIYTTVLDGLLRQQVYVARNLIHSRFLCFFHILIV